MIRRRAATRAALRHYLCHSDLFESFFMSYTLANS